MTEFAPDYPKNDKGWWVFGRDVELRRELFHEDAFLHPAKANLHMVREMGKYLTKPGDSILDPFAGTGSQLISALDGRKVVLIELEPYFLEVISKTLDKWREDGREMADVMVYQGDCRVVLRDLPYLVDAAIFSPPYSTTMASTGIKATGADDDTGTGRYRTEEYSRSNQNLSRLNPFQYSLASDKVFERLSRRIVPGGRVCVISKDRIEGPRRILLSEPVIKRAQRHGLQMVEWLKHEPPSTIAKASATIAMRTHGKEVNVVLDEDLLIFEKVK